ncbi:Protein pyrABCN [Smittium mucronatum]|uniref:Ammonium-dependent carbamoyl phosphate synthetase n=1 Tax=Smittium mucronatum TaxID=133383 RepID=A0A1R0GNJ9_9FUNG|nr:Protein pyrABCN [Smittium mucronatum]
MTVSIKEEVIIPMDIVSGRNSPVGMEIRPFQPIVPPVDFIGPNRAARELEELGASSHVKSTLLLEDGSMFVGYSFGAETKSVSGELVFSTIMSGYPEALTDPSSEGYIMVLTFPLVGNYGVPDESVLDELLKNRLKYFESNRIHITALVIGNIASEYSHYMAKTSLSQWLIKHNVPAIYGVDTRAITIKIREQGAMMGKLLLPKSIVGMGLNTIQDNSWLENYSDVEWNDINTRNLVAEVSTKEPFLYLPAPGTGLKHPSGRNLRILAVDFGLKNKQLSFMVGHGLEVKLVPWDYDFNSEEIIDGLFLSNGPGNPDAIPPNTVIASLKKSIDEEKFPIFGICMGHQVLSIASGAKCMKLKYGNRGANIPCTDLRTGRCYITSQNHGYAVDPNTLPDNIVELFTNANDGTNEGIVYTDKPIFSVQFHPESTPGPQDTEFLFLEFIKLIQRSIGKTSLKGISLPGSEYCVSMKQSFIDNENKPKSLKGGIVVNGKLIRKVLVLGSGGLSIGQAGEFDYSGSQAIKALKEEGLYTILINPNIATIQTSKGLADKCYFLPVTPECVRKVIQYECPDGIYCTFGGQTALNIGVELNSEFESLGVQVLGTPIETINKTEDRELFANALAEIDEKCAESKTAVTVEESLAVGKEIGYPVIVRAAYALGGLGSGFANNEEELRELSTKAFAVSPQILVEKSMKGWKEIEFEVVRDSADNCIVVCNMENFDPLGIHTGDSIVVAPCITLSDSDIQMFRSTAIKVIRHLGVVGECNIQYALNPNSNEYCIIEVNARLSRSSALASKATGYPLAFVAAKLGLGINLNSIKNSVTKVTTACFEPSLDYVIVKMPRWDLNKFVRVNRELSSAMKSVGEVMAIGRTFEECLMEAIRSVDSSFVGFSRNSYVSSDEDELDRELSQPTDKRLFAIANALNAGYSVERIWELTKIDKWFLCRLRSLVETERKLVGTVEKGFIPNDLLREAKQLGFSDRGIAQLTQGNELQIRRDRKAIGLHPVVKQIDTVAAEFPATTNYLYLTYNASVHDIEFNNRGVMVLGSGVYRIGSSVEFDWCAVRAIGTLRSNGYKTIMVNYNPETVSTDYDEADRLYFSNISLERVMDIYELEQSSGVIVAMGGQAPNNIALALHRQNVNILGTSPDYIDNAENRYKFSRMLDQIGIDQPAWRELTHLDDAHAFCEEVKFPVIVRPSYVLSGAAMNVVFSSDDLNAYLEQAVHVSSEYPVVISKFIEDAKEIDVDAVAMDGKMIVHFISEHVENAGVHSGDATLVLPPQDLDPITVRKIEEATAAIGKALNVTGPYNIQFIAKDNEIKVIECNVRAARSFPFVSKSTNVDLVEISVKAMLKLPISLSNYKKNTNYVAVKVPQFSFSRLIGADPIVGVEMASTGEVAAFGKDKYSAYIKALVATGFKMPEKNILVSIGSFKEKLEMLEPIKKMVKMGYNIFATPGTADFFSEYEIPAKFLQVSTSRDKFNLHQYLSKNLIDLYINLPSKNSFRRPASFVSEGYKTRRMAIDNSIPLITNVKCAKMFIEALYRCKPHQWEIESMDYITSHRTVVLPGLIDISSSLGSLKDIDHDSIRSINSAALDGGITCLSILSPSYNSKNSHSINNLGQHQNLDEDCFVTDYVLTISGKTPLAELPEIDSSTCILFIDFESKDADQQLSYSDVSNVFKNFPKDLPIISNAFGTNLASTLLLASLHDRSVHITDVKNVDDLSLINLSKEKGLKVSCDVTVFSLFPLPPTTLSECSDESEICRFQLWEQINFIDILSIGLAPTRVTEKLSTLERYQFSYALALPLLLMAVSNRRISVSDIVSKFSTNPKRVFGFPDQPDTYVEVHLDRNVYLSQSVLNLSKEAIEASSYYGAEVQSALHRVVYHGSTVYLDGKAIECPDKKRGHNLSKILNKVSSTPSGKEVVFEPTEEMSDYRVNPSTSDRASHAMPLVESLRQISVGPKGISGGSLMSPVIKGIKPDNDHLVEQLPSLSPSKKLVDGAIGNRSHYSAEFRRYSDDQIAQDITQSLSITSPVNKILELQRTFLPSILQRFGGVNPFYMQSIISVRQLTKNHLYMLFAVAMELRKAVKRHGVIPLLNDKVMASVFYEPSSRTSCSFQAAMLRLGGQVFSVNAESSSIAKGESLSDTIRTFSSYSDVIVLRHPSRGAAKSVSNLNEIPILNAGDGTGEHPSQAMLDVFTIREELGTINGLTITMVGDLLNGRTVHSLARILSMYRNITINYVSPTEGLQMPSYIIDEINSNPNAENITQMKYYDLDDNILANTDVLYVTRIQKERFASLEEYESSVSKNFVINNAVLKKCKKNMIVMHPLPRLKEISEDVDTDPRAAYFRQMKYGMFVRMALLSLVLLNH